MRYITALIVFATTSVALSGDTPKCAHPCLHKATIKLCGKIDDFDCACLPDVAAAIETASEKCVAEACKGAHSTAEVFQAAEEFCRQWEANHED
ncbi:hypothetical protein PWT90_02832 [Aphanocladium album]|nr:hypothetical protein PWT90_02832 [Aphanocladium album]